VRERRKLLISHPLKRELKRPETVNPDNSTLKRVGDGTDDKRKSVSITGKNRALRRVKRRRASRETSETTEQGAKWRAVRPLDWGHWGRKLGE